jgi:hypothetical protein
MPEVRSQTAALEVTEVVGPFERRQADEDLALSLSLHGCRSDEAET